MSPRLARMVLLFAAATVYGAAAQPVRGGPDASLAAQRELFRNELERARSGDLEAGADSQALRTYPLYAYLQAERLSARLRRASEPATQADSEAQRFLDAHAGEPVAWPLRYAYLVSLARREQWSAYLEHFHEDVSDESLHCRYLGARIALGRTDGIAPLIVERWLTARQLPIECEPVFQWLRDAGGLTDEHVEQRVRLLLENAQPAFARVIAQRLPAERAAPLLRWADLIERPAEELAAYVAAPSDAVESEALRDAWARLSRDAPVTALNLYASVMAAAPPDAPAASAYTKTLALGLAWDRRREALDLFALVAEDDVDDYMLGWQARAALWAGDWALAASSIAAMSERERSLARWRYWAARIDELRHGRRQARAGYEDVLDDDNYYSGMAAARLGRRLRPNLEPLPRDPVIVGILASRAAFVRARELQAMGLPVAALREWRHGYAQLDSRAQRQTVHLAADWQWYDLAVATATRFEVFNDYRLLYPTPFTADVSAAVASTALSAELVYGVIRQESLYRVDAVSGAGARGLMQLRPGTAAQIRDRLDSPDAHADLLNPTVNIRLGTAELDRLLDRYDGRISVALAAYNAGPNAAERWLPQQSLEADVWIENIPFNETREYVQRVHWHTLVFRWLETGRPQSTRDWLEEVSAELGAGPP